MLARPLGAAHAMIQLALVLILALLWMSTITNVGGSDFLKVTVFQVGINVIKVLDMLVGLVILCVIISTRGPLLFTAISLFVLWGLSLFGLPRLFGIEVMPMVVVIMVVGLCVHFVTLRDH
jgi:hypothetical protein